MQREIQPINSYLVRSINEKEQQVKILTLNNNRHLGLRVVVLATLVGLITFALQLDSTSNGRYMPAVHGDWAMHAATTRAIFLQEDLSSSANKTILNEFAKYPKLTYVAAAKIAHFFEISPLQGLTIITIVSIILTCIIYSLRVVSVLLEREVSLFAILLIFICLFVGVNIFEIGFRSTVISNSFISQLASIAIAQLFIYISSKNINPKYFVVLLILSSWILINTHIIGFIWSSASLIIMAMGLKNIPFKVRIRLVAISTLIVAAFLLTSPGILEMMKISGTGGDLRAWNGKNISDYGSIFIFSMLLYVLMLALVKWRNKENRLLIFDVFKHSSGFLSLGPLIFASAITVFSKGGNWYPVAKWIYLFFPELILITLVCFSSNKSGDKAWLQSRIFISVILIVLFFIQVPYFSPKVNLNPAILAEDGVFGKPSFHDRRYPGLLVDHPALNYFIARSVLKIPVDAATYSWMGSGTISKNPLGPEDFISVAPRIQSEEIVNFRIGSVLAKRMISSSWWNFEMDHVWAAHSPATIFFIAATPPTTIKISFVPFMPKGPQLRKYTITINEVKMPEMSANIMNWSQPIVYSIDIPPGLVKIDGRVKIEIEFDPIINDDLGFAMISLKYK